MKVSLSPIKMQLFLPLDLCPSVKISDMENNNDIVMCSSFWTCVMPKVFEQIQENDDAAALKSICCDAFSNIGSRIFERLTVSEVVKCLLVALTLKL